MKTTAHRPRTHRRTTAAVTAVLLSVALTVSGCAGGADNPATPSSAPPFPTATGTLTDDQSRAAFERAAAALQRQRTMAVSFRVESTTGEPLRQVLHPMVRVDLRDSERPLASLALSILASNVAVGGHVYRQETTADGSSTVWVKDAEPKTPLEFVLWKPGASSARVADLGVEQVTDRPARRFRVFDPSRYAGPTATSSTSPPTEGKTTPSGAAATSTRGPAAPSTGATTSSGIGDYDELWFAEDGTVLRMVSVLGRLTLTSSRIEYGADVRIDVPDTGSAITAEEFARQRPGQ
ncbi:hypothetical protein KEM60_02909 [Austwickia sp. TVS 96-490-7B]|uniref:hypothetical protein n=1 Tax=Austwickia sp. TVS 96-490-7B TaxID=2830843 RepID=UPI001C5A1289|nr:hypothetical protein [Austwickia sp. TVS 96-490-7B]MBW3086680.1 hypothetical protein [Austwickia sp. TVS 96-490-7B]